LSAVTAILRDHDISVESMLQKGRQEDSPVCLVFTTHKTADKHIRSACARLHEQAFVSGDILALPIMESE